VTSFSHEIEVVNGELDNDAPSLQFGSSALPLLVWVNVNSQSGNRVFRKVVSPGASPPGEDCWLKCYSLYISIVRFCGLR
jgi:hypothetical protein